MDKKRFELRYLPRDAPAYPADKSNGPIELPLYDNHATPMTIDQLIRALLSVPMDDWDMDFTICTSADDDATDPHRMLSVTNKIPALLQWMYEYRKEYIRILTEKEIMLKQR